MYAMASKPTRGRAIVLTLAIGMEPDFYDVSNALCGVLLKQKKIDDILMLESILRTPLMSLKRRGFNVDRILNAQREEHLRKKAEVAKEREAMEAAKSASLASAATVMAHGREAVQPQPHASSEKGAGAPIPTAPSVSSIDSNAADIRSSRRQAELAV